LANCRRPIFESQMLTVLSRSNESPRSTSRCMQSAGRRDSDQQTLKHQLSDFLHLHCGDCEEILLSDEGIFTRQESQCFGLLLCVAAFHRRPHDNDILLRSAIPAQLKGLRNGITLCTMTSALRYLFSNGAKSPRPESEGSCVFD